MHEDLYQQFLAFKAAGRKSEAEAAVHAFLASFGTEDEKIRWVRGFLERGEYGHRIRHEVYAQLIFPVLLDGYNRQDAWSLYWLAKTAQNLYSARDLHAQVEFRTEMQLLRRAYEIAPEEAFRQKLLAASLDWFAYCQHEWPAGILYGIDGATVDQCNEILQEVAVARTMDNGQHAAFLTEFESKVREYKERLRLETSSSIKSLKALKHSGDDRGVQ